MEEKASPEELAQLNKLLDSGKRLTRSQIDAIFDNKVLTEHKYPVTQFVIESAREALENEKMMSSPRCVAYYHAWCSRRLLTVKDLISDSKDQLYKAELGSLENDLQEIVNQFSSLKEGFILDGKHIPEMTFLANGTFYHPEGSLGPPEAGWPVATKEVLDEIEKSILQIPEDEM